MLVLGVTDIERKRDKLFVCVDGGFNLHPEPAFYDMPCEPVACFIRSRDPADWQSATIGRDCRRTSAFRRGFHRATQCRRLWCVYEFEPLYARGLYRNSHLRRDRATTRPLVSVQQTTRFPENQKPRGNQSHPLLRCQQFESPFLSQHT